jgi:hypothetical protein
MHDKCNTDAYLEERPGMLADVERVNLDWAREMGWGDWICCFTTENMLQWWFSDLLDQLNTQGFQMAIYNVHKEIRFGRSKKQAFFKRHALHKPKYVALPGAFSCAM